MRQPFQNPLTISLISLIILLGSCTKKETITIAGSTTVLPIVSVAAEQFRLKHPDIRVVVNAGGSGVGVNQLGSGKIDVGMVSREITGKEESLYPNVIFHKTSIAKDAVVAVVSSEISDAGVSRLSFKELKMIYTGELTNWKDLGGPDREILVIDKENSRGTRHVFMEAVFGDKNAVAPGADLVLGSNNEEQTAIMQSDAAIGMLSFAWLNDDVVALEIIEGNRSVAPSIDNIKKGVYPITRDLILITDGFPSDNTKLFVEYLLGVEGLEIVEESGYVSIQG